LSSSATPGRETVRARLDDRKRTRGGESRKRISRLVGC
jgi:hypothetical protein